ncbi:transposase family protein [Burkholderia sp. MS455]|nr:transposase family protein [Burkholderia sp. MS455]
MIDRSHALSVSKQARLVGIARSSAYYRPRPVSKMSDQGSQFTANAFTETVLGRGIRLSTDGKGSRRDNVFVERVWAASSMRRSI